MSWFPTYKNFIVLIIYHKKIPTKIVLQMDITDPRSPSYPPCEKCGSLIKPVYFVGYTDIKCTYNSN